MEININIWATTCHPRVIVPGAISVENLELKTSITKVAEHTHRLFIIIQYKAHISETAAKGLLHNSY